LTEIANVSDLEQAQIPDELTGTVYTAVANRRTAFDTLMWQVPALGLTAQAFLLTLAYGASSSEAARLVASVLALAVAVAAIQTMRKHQANELTDARMLESIECTVGITVAGAHPHAKPEARAKAVENKEFEKWSVRKRSFQLWVWSLRLFAGAALVAGAIALSGSSILEGKHDEPCVRCNPEPSFASPERGRGR
jgi:hypothetical protein